MPSPDRPDGAQASGFGTLGAAAEDTALDSANPCACRRIVMPLVMPDDEPNRFCPDPVRPFAFVETENAVAEEQRIASIRFDRYQIRHSDPVTADMAIGFRHRPLRPHLPTSQPLCDFRIDGCAHTLKTST